VEDKKIYVGIPEEFATAGDDWSHLEKTETDIHALEANQRRYIAIRTMMINPASVEGFWVGEEPINEHEYDVAVDRLANYIEAKKMLEDKDSEKNSKKDVENG